MRAVRLFLLCFIALVVAVLAVVAGPPAVFLATVWWKDQSDPLPAEGAGRGDASRLANSQAAEVLTIASDPEAAEKQVADLVRRAGPEG